MPFTQIWIHLVWTTKNRFPFLTEQIRYRVFNHILENAKSKPIYIDHINGYFEHVHLLIGLTNTQSISSIVNLIKGESSHWINKNQLTPTHFRWQNEYFACSVSHSQINKVRAYIRNQEKHHAFKTWDEEYNEFINKYGFHQTQDGA